MAASAAAHRLALGALGITLLVGGSSPAPAEGPGAPTAAAAPAIEAGRRLYRTRCYICHHNEGGRGPNLFATRLSAEQFVEIVINGRKGTQMPAFGLRMDPDQARQVYAFVTSTVRYE